MCVCVVCSDGLCLNVLSPSVSLSIYVSPSLSIHPSISPPLSLSVSHPQPSSQVPAKTGRPGSASSTATGKLSQLTDVTDMFLRMERPEVLVGSAMTWRWLGVHESVHEGVKDAIALWRCSWDGWIDALDISREQLCYRSIDYYNFGLACCHHDSWYGYWLHLYMILKCVHV